MLASSRLLRGTPASRVGPLDLGITFAGAWAVDGALSRTYSGNLFRVRRDTNDVFIDVAPITPGGPANVAAVTALLGTAQGFFPTIYDQTGNGRDFTQTTALFQTRYVLGYNGRPTQRLMGIEQYMQANAIAALLSGSNLACTIIWVEKIDAHSALRSAWGMGDSASFNSRFKVHTDTTPTFTVQRRNSANTLKSFTAGTPSTDRVRIMRLTFDGTDCKLFQDGVQVGATTNLADGGITLNRFGWGTLISTTIFGYFAGDLPLMLVATRALSDAECAAVEANLTTRFKPSTLAPLILLGGEGDSRTLGVTTGGTVGPKSASWPVKLGELMGGDNQCRVFNFALGGQTITQMNADRATQVDVHLAGNWRKKILVVGPSAFNGITQGGTAATQESVLNTYCTAARAAGWTVVVCTETAAQPSSVPYATRAEYNALVVANWATYADAIVRLDLNANMGQDGDEDNTTYFGDKVHYTAAGNTEVANEIYAVVRLL